MNRNQLGRTLLPFALHKQPDGRYVVLNRNYKPIGFTETGRVEYADFPVLYKFADLTADVARQLSYDGSPALDEIYLYSDGTEPTTPEQTSAYLRRLIVLTQLRIAD